MELQHHSCVLPSNAPALPLSESESSIPSRVLQERSANSRHDFADGASSWKRSSPTPAENLYPRQLNGNYFTGNIGSHFNSERSEAYVHKETDRIWALLQRCEKYRKYRERQPKNKEDREQKWPDELEKAFFRGLVRWPPMGRRKHMLDGQLRGRNELVSDSIMRDTGIDRDRKQVSSHIQVVRPMIQSEPSIAYYMSGKDKSLARKRQANLQLRVRNPAGTLTAKYEFSQPGWSGQHLSASLPLEAFLPNASNEQFTVSDFSMFVEAAEQRVHDFTRLTGDSRIGDINVSDLQPWRQQYPEFKFVAVDEFKQRHVIVCDASIKVMTEKLPVASSLIIPFYIQSKNNLEIFESLECRTRFYDKTYDHVQLVTQPIEGQEAKEAKETRTDCEYFADTGSVKLRFGSNFWAHRMQKCSMEIREAGKARMRDDRDDANRKETYVRQLLRNMTAVQDVYGTRKGAEEPICFLTILWRFSQTRTAHEPGKITWRVVNFEGNGAYGTTIVNQQWAQAQAQAQEEDEGEDDEDENMKIISRNTAAATPGSMPAAVYSPLQSVEFHESVEFHQTFGNPPLQLDLDSLSTLASFETMTDFSNPSSATFSAEYSQSQSLPALSHSQETIAGPSQQYPHDASDYDFHGGQITIAGCLEPSINLAAYEQFATHPQSIQALDALAGLEPGHHQDDSNTLLGFGLSVGAGCYPTKPSWHHPDLISRFEGMAEQQNLFGQTAHGDNIAGHGVLHDGQLNPGLWKLQTSFPDDGGISMDHGPKDNRLPREQGDVILEMIERDQQKESHYRPY